MENIGTVKTALPYKVETKDLKNKDYVKYNYKMPNDSLELSTKKTEAKEKSSLSKKIGVGIASTFLPVGIGQVINGEPKKGLKFFAKQAVCAVSAGVGFTIAAAATTAALSTVGTVVLAAAGVGAAINSIACIVDAVKNA